MIANAKESACNKNTTTAFIACNKNHQSEQALAIQRKAVAKITRETKIDNFLHSKYIT